MSQFPALQEAIPEYTASVGTAVAADTADFRAREAKLHQNVRSLARRAELAVPKHFTREQAPVTLTGEDATSEVVHVYSTIPYALLIGRKAKIQVEIAARTIAAVGAHTWRLRLRIGGLTGTVVFDTATWDLEVDTSLYATATLWLTYVEATPDQSTVSGVVRWDNLLAAPVIGNITEVYEEVVDLSDSDADVAIALTSLCSNNDDGDRIQIDAFEVSVSAPSDDFVTAG